MTLERDTKEDVIRFVSRRKAASQAKKSIPKGQRVYAIGDVHGRVDLLHQLLRLIVRDVERSPPEAFTLVWLGDYIDRGPSSREVIETLIRASTGSFHSIFIKGNHEEALLRFLEDPREGEQWRMFGGMTTLTSYGIDVGEIRPGQGLARVHKAFLDAFPRSHRDFLAKLQPSWTIGDFFFSHAGARPGVELEAQDPQDLMWIREEFLTWHRDFGKIVVHGHTPVMQPEMHPNRVNVDTGAYATGRLTCAVIEEGAVRFMTTQPR